MDLPIKIMEFCIKNLVYRIVIVLLLFVTCGCSSLDRKPVSNKQIESEVLEAFKGLAEASESLDAERYFEYFDKQKFSGLNADGTVWHSFENLEKLINVGFPMIEKSISLEFNNVKVTVINITTAILVNEYKQTILLRNGSVINQSGGGTQVWSKSNGQWKLVSVSASESRQ